MVSTSAGPLTDGYYWFGVNVGANGSFDLGSSSDLYALAVDTTVISIN